MSSSKRNSSLLAVFFLVLLLETTTIAVATTSVNSIFHTKHVVVYNFLPNDASFGIHCKSGNNDLGQQVVGAKGAYSFKFKPNIDGSTLFFCGVRWTGGIVVFDIYDYQRDYNRCDRYCIWHVRSDGIVGFIEKAEQPDITIPWPKL